LDTYGIESEVIGKIEYQWQNLIIVRLQNVTDTVAYWTEVGLYLCGDAIGENPCEKLTGFAQRILRSQYHTLMQKWNEYSAR